MNEANPIFAHLPRLLQDLLKDIAPHNVSRVVSMKVNRHLNVS